MTPAPARDRSIYYLAAATFFSVSAIMGTRPVVPLYAVSLDIGAGEVGVLVAVFSLLPLLIATAAGAWMDRHDQAIALILGSAVAALGLLLPFFFTGRAGIYVAQVVAGFGFTVYILAGQSSAGNPHKDSWTRERHIAIFSMAIALGSLIGPALSGYMADQIGFGLTFLIMALKGTLALIPAVVLLMRERRTSRALPPGAGRSKTSPPAGTPWPEPRRIMGYHPYMHRAFLVSILILMGKDMYVAYFPLYAIEAGISATWIGIIIALHNSGGVVMRVLMLPLVRLFGKDRVIVASILSTGLVMLLLPLSQNVWVLLAVSLGLGLGLGIGQPLSISRTINLSPPDKVGEVLGFRLTLNRLTQVVTPLCFGAMTLVTGIAGIFWALGLILALGSRHLSVPPEAEGDSRGAPRDPSER